MHDLCRVVAVSPSVNTLNSTSLRPFCWHSFADRQVHINTPGLLSVNPSNNSTRHWPCDAQSVHSEPDKGIICHKKTLKQLFLELQWVTRYAADGSLHFVFLFLQLYFLPLIPAQRLVYSKLFKVSIMRLNICQRTKVISVPVFSV